MANTKFDNYGAAYIEAPDGSWTRAEWLDHLHADDKIAQLDKELRDELRAQAAKARKQKSDPEDDYADRAEWKNRI